MKTVSWFRYVREPDIPAYAALGWIDLGPLPVPHGFYANLMEWPDDSDPPEPPQVLQ